MPLTTDTYYLGRLKEIVSNFPEEVRAATIRLHDENEYTVKWGDNEGHIITWKEPRK